MKRYSIIIADRGNGIHEAIGNESPAGQFVPFADLHAWALKHKATVDGMEHVDGCASFFCAVCTWYCVTAHTPDDTDPTFHAAVPGQCNCPRGDALREIEELL